MSTINSPPLALYSTKWQRHRGNAKLRSRPNLLQKESVEVYTLRFHNLLNPNAIIDQTDADFEANCSENELDPEITNSNANEFPTPLSRPLSPSPDPDDIRFILRPNIYHCTFENCNRSFNRPCRLADHIRSHTGDRPFVCDHPGCDKSFTRDSHLVRHVKSTHANIRNFQCPWEGCGKAFATGQRMRTHYASHEKYKDFTCSGYAPCREVFRKKTTLQAHITSIHLGAKPFPCPYTDEATRQQCKKGYITQAKLNAHISREHTGERYVCILCENSAPTDSGISMSFNSPGVPGTPASTTASMAAHAFPTFQLLQLHIETCHPLACPYCHTPMASNRDLASHSELLHPDVFVPMASSSDGKQEQQAEAQSFSCTYENCSRVFTKSGNLKVHIRCVHEKSTPFVCNTADLTSSKRLVNEAGEKAEWLAEEQGCELGFGTKALLENHVRMKHLALGSWDSHLKRLKGVTTRGRGGGNQKKQEVSAASLLTGGAYQECGRDVHCLQEGCEDVLYREYDLRLHCSTKHGMAEVEIEERILERAALEGGVFWVGESSVGGFGWYDDNEDDYDEHEQILDQEQEFPIDPALEERMEAVAGYVQ
jgi:general transcription factor IIIA